MKNRPLCFACLSFVLAVILAVVVGRDRVVKELRPSYAEQYLEEDEKVLLKGRVYRKEDKEKYQVLYLKDNSVKSYQQSLKESKMIVYDEHRQRADIGDVLLIEGEISFFEHARNPGNFDSKLYYQRQGIHGRVWASSVERQRGQPPAQYEKIKNQMYEFRQEWKKRLCAELGEKDGNTLSAMLLGEKGQMDEEVRELYQANGIGHILAISGLHLSFIGIGMYKMLRRLTGSYPIGGVFGILFLALYILMIGFTVSAVRALVMFLFRVGADMTGRHYDAPTALSFAAAVVLIWRPLSLYDGGFWLSFGAVLGVLVVVPVVSVVQESIPTGPPIIQVPAEQADFVRQGIPKCTPYWTKTICPKVIHCGVSLGTPKGTFVQAPFNGNVLEDNLARTVSVRKVHAQSSSKQNTEDDILPIYLMGVWERVWQVISQGLVASIGINLVIFPILLYYFFEFPLYSFILNLFVVPLMSVLLFLGMAGSLCSLWIVPVSVLLFRICSKILWIYKVSCEMVFQLPGARLVIGRPDMWQMGVYYGILVIILLLLREKERLMEHVDGKSDTGIQIRATRLGRFALMLGVAGIIILTFRWGEWGKLTTVVLDVGQGDGIFMRGPKGGTYLVDGGSSDVKKAGQYRIESFLKSQGVRMVDYVLISHGDSDHISGVEEMIERQDIGVRIGTLVLPVREVWDEALKGLAEKALANGTRVAVIETGQNIKEGNMSIACIQPGNEGAKAENGETDGRAAEEGYEPGNAASMVLAVKFGEFEMLLTGDVEGEGEEQLTKQLEEQYQDCTWEILKVAHHGSKNSSTEEFLRQIKPVYAFISAGQENRYGHPHQETIERLADVGSKIYSTQENGAIIVEVEGGETMKVGKTIFFDERR